VASEITGLTRLFTADNGYVAGAWIIPVTPETAAQEEGHQVDFSDCCDMPKGVLEEPPGSPKLDDRGHFVRLPIGHKSDPDQLPLSVLTAPRNMPLRAPRRARQACSESARIGGSSGGLGRSRPLRQGPRRRPFRCARLERVGPRSKGGVAHHMPLPGSTPRPAIIPIGLVDGVPAA
jgi:hypothetical protein